MSSLVQVPDPRLSLCFVSTQLIIVLFVFLTIVKVLTQEYGFRTSLETRSDLFLVLQNVESTVGMSLFKMVPSKEKEDVVGRCVDFGFKSPFIVILMSRCTSPFFLPRIMSLSKSLSSCYGLKYNGCSPRRTTLVDKRRRVYKREVDSVHKK